MIKMQEDHEHTRDGAVDFWQLLKQSTAKTGVQGMNNIGEARSRARRVFWAVVVVVGTVLFVWQVTTACVHYFDYPVSTVTVQHSAQMSAFPAVTFCNLNPLRDSAVRDSESVVGKMFASFANGNDTVATAHQPKPTQFPAVAEEWDEDGNLLNQTGPDLNFTTETTEFQAVERFGTLVTRLTRGQRQRAGHQLSDMLLTCVWNGRPCNSNNFTHFYNYLYGNCFTFNGPTNNISLATTRTGPLYGLTLTLFVEQYEYIESLSDAAGVRLVVHNQTAMPFPEDDGISVGPGTKTGVGLRRHTTTRMSPPYGDCADYTDQDNLEHNAYVSDVPTVQYSTKACMKTCFQRHLMENCGCYSTQFPIGRNLTAFAGIDVQVLRPCEDETQEDTAEYLSCADEMKMLFQTDQIRCSDECPHTCSEVHYGYSISQSAWPSTVKQTAVLNELYWRSDYLWSTLNQLSGTELSDFISNNVLVVEVYFETFQFEELRTEPSYQMTDLLSDIGGQGGLWLGISVVAMCELVELLVDFLVLMVMRLQVARRSRVGSPVLPLHLRE